MAQAIIRFSAKQGISIVRERLTKHENTKKALLRICVEHLNRMNMFEIKTKDT